MKNENEQKAAPVQTREVWLRNAIEAVRSLVEKAACATIPPVHISVGFPKGARGKGRAIGQCWDGAVSADGQCHVFICPTLATSADVLPTLVHELFHATVGVAAKHRGPFARAMKAAGMVKPFTCSLPSPELATELARIAEILGAYPHSPIALVPRGKKGSRLRLWECSCGVKVRVARDDFSATCGLCNSEFAKPGEGGGEGGRRG